MQSQNHQDSQRSIRANDPYEGRSTIPAPLSSDHESDTVPMPLRVEEVDWRSF